MGTTYGSRSHDGLGPTATHRRWNDLHDLLWSFVISAEEKTIMKRLVGRFGILVGVLAAVGLLTFTPGLGFLGADAQDGTAVTIVDFAFQPASLEIPAGTTMTWTNSGAATHTATADNGAFDSGRLAPGASFSQTFNSAGTFTYHCEIHPQMTGTIVVTEASPAPAAAPDQGAQQAEPAKQEQAPKPVQMPNTGVGTMDLAGRASAFMVLMGLVAVGLGASAVLIRRRV
jgi:plastocyanin